MKPLTTILLWLAYAALAWLASRLLGWPAAAVALAGCAAGWHGLYRNAVRRFRKRRGPIAWAVMDETRLPGEPARSCN